MTAVVQDITMYKGAEMQFNFTLQAPLPPGGIGGWTILFTVAKKANSASKLISRAATVTDPTLCIFQVALDADDTDELKPATYFYDVWRTDADEEQVMSIGNFVLLPVARLPPATP